MQRPTAGRPPRDEDREPMKRINVTFRPDALERIDAEAERLEMTRSAYLEAMADPQQRPALLARLAELGG